MTQDVSPHTKYLHQSAIKVPIVMLILLKGPRLTKASIFCPKLTDFHRIAPQSVTSDAETEIKMQMIQSNF